MYNIFEGSLVRLRAVQPGDEENVFRQMQESEISRRDSSVEWPKSLAEVKEKLERHDRQGKNDEMWLMIETLDGRIVGGVITQLSDPRNGVFSGGSGWAIALSGAKAMPNRPC